MADCVVVTGDIPRGGNREVEASRMKEPSFAEGSPATVAGKSPAVVLVRDEGIATITLNRPKLNNAWSSEVAAGFSDAVDVVTADAQVRAIVITGSGKSFCVGGDKSRLMSLSDESGGRSLRPSPWEVPQALRLRELDKPVIAAINGGCAGIGLLIALCADVRFCADSAKLSTAYSRRGLPAEYGLSWLLTRMIGMANASDLLLSGRVIDGLEAHHLGLVNWITSRDALMDAAHEYALDLARSCSPAALRMIKRQISHDLETTFESSLLVARFLLDAANQSDDFREGVRSLIENRSPHFYSLDDGRL
jgi:enoyl-CoA hydratase/carnithine racemase